MIWLILGDYELSQSMGHAMNREYTTSNNTL